MKDPRCWREVLIRGGITLIIVAIAFVFLDADPWVWIVPPAVASLTVFKWAVRPASLDDDPRDDAPGVGDLL